VPGAARRSGACSALLRGSVKARLQWDLERALRAFERRRRAPPR